jgi:hypothetical protein
MMYYVILLSLSIDVHIYRYLYLHLSYLYLYLSTHYILLTTSSLPISSPSRWMTKQPPRSYTGGRLSSESDKESRRFLRLRDNILRYDTADTLSIPQTDYLSPAYVAVKSDGDDPLPAPSGMLKVLSEKSSPSGPVNPEGYPPVSFSATIDTPTAPGPGGSLSSHLSSITDKLTEKLFSGKAPAKIPVRGRGDAFAAVMGAISSYAT